MAAPKWAEEDFIVGLTESTATGIWRSPDRTRSWKEREKEKRDQDREERAHGFSSWERCSGRSQVLSEPRVPSMHFGVLIDTHHSPRTDSSGPDRKPIPNSFLLWPGKPFWGWLFHSQTMPYYLPTLSSYQAAYHQFALSQVIMSNHNYAYLSYKW